MIYGQLDPYQFNYGLGNTCYGPCCNMGLYGVGAYGMPMGPSPIHPGQKASVDSYATKTEKDDTHLKTWALSALALFTAGLLLKRKLKTKNVKDVDKVLKNKPEIGAGSSVTKVEEPKLANQASKIEANKSKMAEKNPQVSSEGNPIVTPEPKSKVDPKYLGGYEYTPVT